MKDSSFLIILEYIPSFNLIELTGKVDYLLDEANSFSRTNLIELGRILAFNIFINNQSDFSVSEKHHIPKKPNNLSFINLENLLNEIYLEKLIPDTNFKSKRNNFDFNILTNEIYLINSKCNCLEANNKDNLSKISEYLNDLNDLFNSIFSELKLVLLKKGFTHNASDESFMIDNTENNIFIDNKFLNNIRIEFKSKLNYHLTNKSIFYMLMGMIILINDVCSVDLKDLDKILYFVENKSIRKDDHFNFFAKKFKDLNIDYFKYMISLFQDLRGKFVEIFDWIEDVSMGLYSIKFSYGLEEILNYQENLLFDLIPENKNNEGNKNFEELKNNKIEINSNKVNNKNDYQLDPISTKMSIEENQKRNFFTDVQNGIYDYMDITNDMIMEKIKIENSEK